MSDVRMPTHQDLLWPTLKALEAAGGSASNEELSEHVAAIMKFPDEVLDVQHRDGPMSEVDFRAAWARTGLRLIGAVDNSARGVWAITDVGRSIASEADVRRRVKELVATQRRAQRHTAPPQAEDAEEEQAVPEQTWEEALLAIMRGLHPAKFERLCQRVLRESGFIKVEVTGRTGDGGIDGSGVLRVNLLSFHVRFQCKRYSGVRLRWRPPAGSRADPADYPYDQSYG